MPAPALDPVRALFEKLADEFDFSSKIVDRFMELKLQSLSDFRFYVQDETEIEKAFIEGVADLETPGSSWPAFGMRGPAALPSLALGRPRR